MYEWRASILSITERPNDGRLNGPIKWTILTNETYQLCNQTLTCPEKLRTARRGTCTIMWTTITWSRHQGNCSERSSAKTLYVYAVSLPQYRWVVLSRTSSFPPTPWESRFCITCFRLQQWPSNSCSHTLISCACFPPFLLAKAPRLFGPILHSILWVFQCKWTKENFRPVFSTDVNYVKFTEVDYEF